jgi:hypothetical protein
MLALFLAATITLTPAPSTPDQAVAPVVVRPLTLAEAAAAAKASGRRGSFSAAETTISTPPMPLVVFVEPEAPEPATTTAHVYEPVYEPVYVPVWMPSIGGQRSAAVHRARPLPGRRAGTLHARFAAGRRVLP